MRGAASESRLWYLIMMNRVIEKRWFLFLLMLLLASFGLLTGFSFRGTSEIQLYDTYFLIENLHLLILLFLALLIAYLASFGLKILAKSSRTAKVFSIAMSGLLGLGLVVLLGQIILSMVLTPSSVMESRNFG